MRDAGASRPSVETIFAPATGESRGAIAVIRISGPAAHEAIAALTGAPAPRRRVLSVRPVFDADGELLDRAMVVIFPQGASYTGEAMGEIHCHGGRAVLSGVLGRLGSLPGLRLAEPGEFTRRALLAGRMDLSEVEGLGDLIAAETAGQRRQALRQQSGAVSRRAESWRAPLLRARALLEVTIDWADEDDVPHAVGPEVETLLAPVIAGMEAELAAAGAAERMRAGFEVALVGPPNVGKSSLLNAIAGREAAIVSDIAGTTRDVLELRCELGGLPVTFLDMAGIRSPGDPVEAIGVERARARARAADLRLLLRSADVPADADVEEGHRRAGDVVVWAKADLDRGHGDLAVSVAHDEGVGQLLDLVRTRLSARAGEAGVLVNARQRRAVEAAVGHLKACRNLLGEDAAELAAEELMLATDALDRLVGRIGVEEVLGHVFAGFCLGK